MLKNIALQIATKSIEATLPEPAIKKHLQNFSATGQVYVIAVGKAAWRMANAASQVLQNQISAGIVITKYHHSQGQIPSFQIFEAAHPIPDENSLIATEKAITLVSNLSENDTVLFLLSGGGSSLFEMPLATITLSQIQKITDKLLRSGAHIQEINTIRKHLSAVKGGKFAKLIAPAKIKALILSDVIGNSLGDIASGPVVADISSSEEALQIMQKYNINVEKNVWQTLKQETPKEISNSTATIIGSVETVCSQAKKIATELGFKAEIVATDITFPVKKMAKIVAAKANELTKKRSHLPCALIWGGETVVEVTGSGIGGRNQELAFTITKYIANLNDVVVLAIGTDGTDGPTDAAGGMVDGNSYQKLLNSNIDYQQILAENNSYTALKQIGDLIITGPTGTNVNDLIILLIQ